MLNKMRMPWEIAEAPVIPPPYTNLWERITDHAAERFRERIRRLPSLPLQDVKMEMGAILERAKPKHLNAFVRGKQTVYIPTEQCMFIGSHGRIVTVIAREDGAR